MAKSHTKLGSKVDFGRSPLSMKSSFDKSLRRNAKKEALKNKKRIVKDIHPVIGMRFTKHGKEEMKRLEDK